MLESQLQHWEPLPPNTAFITSISLALEGLCSKQHGGLGTLTEQRRGQQELRRSSAPLHLAHSGARTRPGQCDQYREASNVKKKTKRKRKGGKDRILLDTPITRQLLHG